MVGGIENEGESMPRTRKSHPPSLKARVAVEAIKRHRTTAQIAQMFGVHPDPGRRLEETGVGRFARRLRQRPRADAPTGRRRKGRSLQADRPNESGAGLLKKKELAWVLPDQDQRLNSPATAARASAGGLVAASSCTLRTPRGRASASNSPGIP